MDASLRDRSIQTVRRVAAPRERVFRAFTDPAQVGLWWGPAGFRNTVHAMDVRPGGTWRYTMHGPDGTDWPNIVQYTDVVAPARLVYRHGDEAPDGSYRHAFDVTIEFAEDGPTHTIVSMTMVFPDRATRDRTVEAVGAIDGARQTFDRLETFVGQELVVTRRVAAPRARVWRAWSEATDLAKWWGPAGRALTVEAFDFRVGGTFRFRMGDGPEAWYARLTYRAIEPPHRLEYDASFCDAGGRPGPAPFDDDWPVHILYEVVFEEADGATTLHLRGRPLNASGAQQKTFRDHFESMRGGFGAMFEQLATHLGGGARG